MKYKGLYIFTIVVIIIAAAWGISKRQSYTNVISNDDFMEQMVVAELPEELASNICNEMEDVLVGAPVILRVKPMKDMEYFFMSGIQSVLVMEVYKGNEIQVGQELYLNFPRWSIVLTEKYDTVQCGFVNVMKENKEYLVFLNNPYEGLNGEKVYPFIVDSYVVPMFCYMDSENVVVPIDEGSSTYVPYSLVKENEFFVTSENALQALLKLKRHLLDKYPRNLLLSKCEL